VIFELNSRIFQEFDGFLIALIFTVRLVHFKVKIELHKLKENETQFDTNISNLKSAFSKWRKIEREKNGFILLFIEGKVELESA